MMTACRMLLQFLFISLWGVILGYGSSLFASYSFDMILYRLVEESVLSHWTTALFMAGGILLMAGMAGIHHRRGQGNMTLFVLNQIFAPLLLLLPLYFFPVKMYTLLLFLVIFGVVLFRYCYFISSEKWNVTGGGKWRKYWLPGVVVIVFFAFVLYGYGVQKQAFNVMYMCWSDWGYYLEAILNTIKGKWFWVNILHVNFLGSRFCPGIIILLPYIALFSSPYAFFLMNSFVLGSGGLVVYLLCRRMNFSAVESTVFGVTYFLIPGFLNLNLCSGYGFREVYLTIPAVLLAFYFYEGKKYLPAILFFLFSMTFQETVPVLWLGFGLVALLQRRLRLATLLIGGSLAYYYFANYIAVPYFRGAFINASMFRYAHLGSNAWEIVLSPLSRPEAFWGALFRPGTFYFMTLLLLPVFILTLSSPLGLGAAAIIFVFVCIESSNQTQNIMLPYQVMILEVIILNTIYCYQRLKRSEVSPWFKFLLLGIKYQVNHNQLRGAVLITIPVISFLCFCCFSQVYFSRIKQSNFQQMYDCRGVINELKTLIPSGVELTASERVAGHFMGRNDVYHDVLPITVGKYPLRDYVVFDVLDPFCPDELRDFLLKSNDFRLIFYRSVPGHHIMLWKREAGKIAVPRPLVKIVSENWGRMGIPLTLNSPDFSMRVVFIKDNEQRIARFMLRLEKTVNYDVSIHLKLLNGQKKLMFTNIFGNGYCPAFMAEPGETFVMDAVLPDAFGTPQSVECELKTNLKKTGDEKLPERGL